MTLWFKAWDTAETFKICTVSRNIFLYSWASDLKTDGTVILSMKDYQNLEILWP